MHCMPRAKKWSLFKGELGEASTPMQRCLNLYVLFAIVPGPKCPAPGGFARPPVEWTFRVPQAGSAKAPLPAGQ
jgi:hypothetical protein